MRVMSDDLIVVNNIHHHMHHHKMYYNSNCICTSGCWVQKYKIVGQFNTHNFIISSVFHYPLLLTSLEMVHLTIRTISWLGHSSQQQPYTIPQSLFSRLHLDLYSATHQTCHYSTVAHVLSYQRLSFAVSRWVCQVGDRWHATSRQHQDRHDPLVLAALVSSKLWYDI